MKLTNAQEEILKILQKSEKLSTTKIANTVRIDNNYALKILTEMSEAGLILKTVETIATYWSITDKGRKINVRI